ncbi:MAG: PEP/pyruvate-binding domain-containing protein [Anaerolineaceae bacterium]
MHYCGRNSVNWYKIFLIILYSPRLTLKKSTALSILPLNSPLDTLDLVGGKGANLALLARAGFPVPGGFMIPTSAYRAFVKENQIDEKIDAVLSGLKSTDAQELEDASQRIRSAFTAGSISDDMKFEILSAFEKMGGKAAAVRSSATAEDLPELSFAGQQDTFLNILSNDALISKVIECWSSLWTARAIGYRLRQHVSQNDIALAVVVQQMVESDTSGVLFSANPLSGLRSETVIDATLGLGEALVSGLVEPDHYVVDTLTNEIRLKQIGSKKLSIRATAGDGTRQINEKAGEKQALTDEQILALAEMGKRVQAHFGSPQDIEWAFSGDKLFLLQSRPITSLFPLPEGIPAEPLKVFFSFSAVQGLMDPVTPLGQSALKSIFSTGASLFGIHNTEDSQTVLFSSGERLWVNFTTLIKNSFGRKVIPVALALVEPTIRQAVLQIQDDPRLLPGKQGISWHARRQMARFGIPLAGNVMMNILSPARRRMIIVNNGEYVLKRVEEMAQAISGDRFQKLIQQVDLFGGALDNYLPHTFVLFVSGVASGMASWNALNLLTKKAIAGDASQTLWNDLILQTTRGMPFNPTTEMDLLLWKMAQTIRSDPASLQVMLKTTPAELARLYQKAQLPPLLSAEISGFLQRYGGRGLGEIDLGRTRWAEDPTHVFEMLASFLQIADSSKGPDVIFAQGVASANDAIEQLAHLVRKSKGGWIKARMVRFFGSRARQLMGIRESPKFFAVRMLWIIHRELLKTGQEFVEAGELAAADDVFYLSFGELKALAGHTDSNWKSLIAERRERYQQELRRRQIPRLLMSDGRAFYEGMAAPLNQGADSITGSPVSPGVVEGLVRVVLDPSHANLVPGEILVCPGTDPSWTPLFLVAGGLIMEVGGMMTHGAVVAREYGIPAAVGVSEATTRLVTGQRIRLNGSNGEITLLK